MEDPKHAGTPLPAAGGLPRYGSRLPSFTIRQLVLGHPVCKVRDAFAHDSFDIRFFVEDRQDYEPLRRSRNGLL
jgi:hypothetical protein